MSVAAALTGLMELPGVSDSATRARERVDELLWNRGLRQHGAALARAVTVESAQACAAIDGIDFPVQAWASGDAFDDSPIGRAAAGVFRVVHELRSLTDTWSAAPLQALARMHSLVARDIAEAEELGRPRSTDEVDDPLRLKSVTPVQAMKVRLSAITEIATEPAAIPAVVESAVIHGELMSLRPFRWGSGPVARQSARLVLAARGVDPDYVLSVDLAFQSMGRPTYVDGIRSYMSGSPEGVAKWLRLCADAVAVGARISEERLAELG